MLQEHETMIAALRERWLGDARSTVRCDRPAAEALVAAAYTAAGLEPPATVIWMDSPLGGVLAAYGLKFGVSGHALRQLAVRDLPEAVLAGLRERLPGGADELPDDGRDDLDAVRDQMSRNFYQRDPVSEPLWGPLNRSLQNDLETHWDGPLSDPWGIEWSEAAEIWYYLGKRLDPIRERVGWVLGSAVAGRLVGDLQHELPAAVRADLRDIHDVSGVAGEPDAVRFWNVFGGQLDPWGDAYFLAMFEAAVRVAGLPRNDRLDTLLAAVRALGWWWPRKESVVLTDRPTGFRLRDDGTVIGFTYADGYRVGPP